MSNILYICLYQKRKLYIVSSLFHKSFRCKNCKDCETQSPLFRHLSDQELEMVNGSRYEVSYRTGETVIKQGTDSTHVITLTSGLAKIYIEGFFNRNLILRIAKPPEMFGGPGFHTDGRHHYTVTAVSDCTCCYMDGKLFRHLVETNIRFANELIRKINYHEIHSFEKLISLTQKQVPGRVAEMLLYLQKDIYCSNPFSLTLSRQDLAEMTGLSKESVIRILKEFKDEGLIESQGDNVEIRNYETLQRIAIAG